MERTNKIFPGVTARTSLKQAATGTGQDAGGHLFGRHSPDLIEA